MVKGGIIACRGRFWQDKTVPVKDGTLVDGLAAWLDVRGMASLDRMRGMLSQSNIRHPEEYQRANYIKILQG